MQYFSIVFHRLLRLWPTLAFVAFFQMTLFRFCIDAPVLKDVDSYRYGCEVEIWKTLLFVSNYLGKTCVDVAWYVSADMQLFILAPLLLILMHRSEKGLAKLFIFSILLVLLNLLAILLIPEAKLVEL